MSIYVDTAEIKEIMDIKNYPFVSGVTTNPKLISSALGASTISEQQFFDYVKKLKSMVVGEIFVQTNYQQACEMVDEAKKLHEILGDNGIIKIPATLSGLQAISELTDANIRTAATAVFTGVQAYTAMCSGAEFVIPYYSRIMRSMHDGLDLVEDILDIIDNHGYDCRLLVASIKTPFDVLEMLKVGVHAITLPIDLIGELIVNSNTFDAIDEFRISLSVVKD